MCDNRLWSQVVEALSGYDDYQCHFLSINQQPNIAEILGDIQTQLPNEKVTLIGFSLGGYLASAFAVQYPDFVEHLLVIANYPAPLPAQEIRERTRIVAWIKRNGYNGIALRRVLALLDKSAQQDKEIIQLIIDMDHALGENVLTHQLLVTTMRENLVDALRQLTISKHFCVGENDNLVSVESLKKLSSDDEEFSLKVLNNTGHMVPLEQPKLLAQWINSIV